MCYVLSNWESTASNRWVYCFLISLVENVLCFPLFLSLFVYEHLPSNTNLLMPWQVCTVYHTNQELGPLCSVQCLSFTFYKQTIKEKLDLIRIINSRPTLLYHFLFSNTLLVIGWLAATMVRPFVGQVLEFPHWPFSVSEWV